MESILLEHIDSKKIKTTTSGKTKNKDFNDADCNNNVNNGMGNSDDTYSDNNTNNTNSSNNIGNIHSYHSFDIEINHTNKKSYINHMDETLRVSHTNKITKIHKDMLVHFNNGFNSSHRLMFLALFIFFMIFFIISFFLLGSYTICSLFRYAASKCDCFLCTVEVKPTVYNCICDKFITHIKDTSSFTCNSTSYTYMCKVGNNVINNKGGKYCRSECKSITIFISLFLGEYLAFLTSSLCGKYMKLFSEM